MDERAEEEGDKHCALEGGHGDVRFARMRDGTYPAEEFWNSLTINQQAAFMTLFQAITDNPALRLFNRQMFKQIEGELFEFKRNQYQMRIFTFRRDNVWYLSNGLSGKKEDKLEPGDVKRAMDFMREGMAVLDSERKAQQKKVRKP